MHANTTNKKVGIIFPELSYRITGLLFEVHNALGRYAKERQYCDALESLLRKANISYEREKSLPLELIGNQRTNLADFVVEGKILLELKAKNMVLKEDYFQTQRYLQAGSYKLGLIVNFRNKYLRPIRVIRANS